MVSVRYRTHDLITTVGSVWDGQHGNQSGTTKSDVRINSPVRGEMTAQRGKCNHHFYPVLFDKRDWHENTSVLL